MTRLKEYDIPFEDTIVHCWEGGSGLPVLMLHGSGAGASIPGNFKRVLEPLAERFHVLAADLVGFGESGRKKAEPYFDMALWGRQARHLVSRLPGGPVGVIGHSLSGALALKLAAAEKRVAGVITTGTMGVSFPGVPGARGWTYPEDREKLRLSAEGTVFTKSLIDEAELDQRTRILTAPGYREYFSSMFARERQHYIDASAVTEDELSRVQCPVLLMHGAQDQSFPAERTSLVLVKSLPNADAVVLGRCGHSVALEYPEKFLVAASEFFGGIAAR
jgi:2-hydroxymuconate-semialdehyde hydrolase